MHRCASVVDKRDEYNNISVDFPRYRCLSNCDVPR